MAEQRYDLQKMKDIAINIQEQNGELDKVVSEIEGIVAEMAKVWRDETQAKFTKQFNELAPELHTFCKEIKTFSDRVIKHANDIINAGGGY